MAVSFVARYGLEPPREHRFLTRIYNMERSFLIVPPRPFCCLRRSASIEMKQRLAVSSASEIDLEERVRLIVELWGEGEALDEDEVVRVAGSLYGAEPEEVREAIVENLRRGTMKGKFYVTGSSI